MKNDKDGINKRRKCEWIREERKEKKRKKRRESKQGRERRSDREREKQKWRFSWHSDDRISTV